eukprot:COSAG04_NODE_9931_length_819_cov_1.077778_2_plen_54_part_00
MAEPAVAAVESEVFLGIMRHSARVDNADDAAQTDLDGKRIITHLSATEISCAL